MWLINCAIIFIVLVLLVVFYLKNRFDLLLCGIIVSYFNLPALRVGQFGITSSYCITALLVVLFLIELMHKRIHFTKAQLFFVASMAVSLVFVFLGWIINGSPKLPHLIHFAGLSQYIVATFLVSVLFRSAREKGSPESVLFMAMPLVLGINYVFTFTQYISYDFGKALLLLLYAYPGKTGPIKDMDTIHIFARAFGAAYTPIIMAITVLLFCAFLFGQSLNNARLDRKTTVLFFLSLSLSFLAFSKTAIMGIFIVVVFALILAVIYFRRAPNFIKYIKIISAYTANILIVGTVVAAFAFSIGLGNQVKYYYGFIISPLNALSTRYEHIGGNEQPNTPTTEPNNSSPPSNTDEPEGNMKEAYEVFREHPIIGVGPAPIRKEFIGDSQFIAVLHDGGLLSFSMYALFYLWLLASFFLKLDYSRILIITVLGISCLSIPILTYACTIPFVAYCIAADDNQYLFVNAKKRLS